MHGRIVLLVAGIPNGAAARKERKRPL